MTPTKVKKLVAYFNQFESFSIAVSGGIDSMILAYIANRFSNAKVKIVHAFSPAVPDAALQRVKQHAKRYQWDLQIVNAREFADPNYINNPLNRCYFCKSNLYTRISECNQGVIFSGTNLDDLSDYRPGLEAAKELSVKHPYVEVGIDKAAIYSIAEHFGLAELHALPAQPCLASRVETGIKINADDLGFINKIEEKTRLLIPLQKNIRCRITHQGTFVEIDKLPETRLFDDLSNVLSHMCEQDGRIFSGIRTYQKGSAFINGVAHV
ncbi:hypothetical protein [Paraglaciecola arctica]|uniref:hypothetical protein n=1 Tax=Paraglaciecola arctica TaxID=1128911 RepID=UPI001C069D9C|nr:hypothetical protein [Paraglaciecola arctica]MBU3002369.1 hypothetical protein [Paraglaciecola arctica]